MKKSDGLQNNSDSNCANFFSWSLTIESKRGFTFAIELLAKAYRNNYKITEVPSNTPIRKKGKSKFKYKTIIFYLPWFINILFSRINSKNEKN